MVLCKDRMGETEEEKLQWGHGREAMDGRTNAPVVMSAFVLQWGHGREAMDGSRPQRPLPSGGAASMGPRP